MDNRMVIGITMGDPASIGPEITVKVLADKAIYEVCRPIVIGDACVLEAARKLVGHEELTVRAVKDVKDGVFTFGTIDVLDMGLVSMEQLVRGQISAMCGDAAFQYVKKSSSWPWMGRLMRRLPTLSIRKRSIWPDTIILVIRKSMRI